MWILESMSYPVQNTPHNVVHEWYALAKSKLEHEATNYEKDNCLKTHNYLVYLSLLTQHKSDWMMHPPNTAQKVSNPSTWVKSHVYWEYHLPYLNCLIGASMKKWTLAKSIPFRMSTTQLMLPIYVLHSLMVSN